MYKVLLHEYYTKRDTYGNVYHTVRVTNPKTEKTFFTSTPSISNITHILNELFPTWNKTGKSPYYITQNCMVSTRLSSLPNSIYLACCHPDDKWKEALRKIGYRLPKTDKE